MRGPEKQSREFEFILRAMWKKLLRGEQITAMLNIMAVSEIFQLHVPSTKQGTLQYLPC